MSVHTASAVCSSRSSQCIVETKQEVRTIASPRYRSLAIIGVIVLTLTAQAKGPKIALASQVELPDERVQTVGDSKILLEIVRAVLDQPETFDFSRLEEFANGNSISDADRNRALFALGYARIKTGQPKEAITSLEQVGVSSIADYVVFNPGLAYFQAGRLQDAINTLQGFSSKYSDSLLKRDAAIVMANAFTAADKPREAIAILEHFRSVKSGDIELSLGRAWIKAGDVSRGAGILQDLVYSLPLTWQADIARRELLANPNWTVSPPTLATRRQRADALFNAKRWNDAAEELAVLLKASANREIPEIRVRMALALRRAGRTADARRQLGLVKPGTGQYEVERLLAAAEIARASSDEKQFMASLGRLRAIVPRSASFEQVLLSAANYYLLRSEVNKSAGYFREMERRFPENKNASYACWKAGWLDYRQGNLTQAKKAFDSYLTKYPNSRELTAALYWRGRIAEREKDQSKAILLYSRLVKSYPYTFYGYQASLKLGRNRPTIPFAFPKVNVEAASFSSRTLRKPHLERSRELERTGLAELAATELRAANLDSGDLTREVSRIYREAGLYHRSLQAARAEFPNYLSASTGVPQIGWKSLFPIPDWPEVAEGAARHQLDAELVLALIRQESEFNPRAVSSANAIGLMQLLPSTAQIAGKRLGLGMVSPQDLKRPETNLRVGIYHFRQLMDEFGGQKEYALAAYNAGSSRVHQWLATGPYDDINEFVESIPFTETREYVQSIIRNEDLYRRLYARADAPANVGEL